MQAFISNQKNRLAHVYIPGHYHVLITWDKSYILPLFGEGGYFESEQWMISTIFVLKGIFCTTWSSKNWSRGRFLLRSHRLNAKLLLFFFYVLINGSSIWCRRYLDFRSISNCSLILAIYELYATHCGRHFMFITSNAYKSHVLVRYLWIKMRKVKLTEVK